MMVKKELGQGQLSAQRALQRVVLSYDRWLVAEVGRAASERERETVNVIRDSIRYRLSAVLFHLELLENLYGGSLEYHRENPSFHSLRAKALLRDTAASLQYVFDDLVFNTISLFEYIGCLIGLVVEGLGSHKITWPKALGKVSQVFPNSNLDRVLVGADSPFVSTLRRYRSEVSHFRGDAVDGRITVDLSGQGDHRLHVTVPEYFVQRVHPHRDVEERWQADDSIVSVGEDVVRSAVTRADEIFKTMVAHVESLSPTGPPSDAGSLIARWTRAGILDGIVGDPRLRDLEVERIGTQRIGSMMRLHIRLTDGERRVGEGIDLGELVTHEPDVDWVREFLIQATIEVVEGGGHNGEV